jgi:hypothetical protein
MEASYCKTSVTTNHVPEYLDLSCQSTVLSNPCCSLRIKNQDLHPYRTDIRKHVEFNRMATSQTCLEERIPNNPAICDEMALGRCVQELSGTIPEGHASIFHSQVLPMRQTTAFFAGEYSG